MTAHPGYAPPHRLRDRFADSQMRVGLLAAAAAIAIVAVTAAVLLVYAV